MLEVKKWLTLQGKGCRVIERVAGEPGGWQCSVFGVDDGYTNIFTYNNSLNSS